MQNMVAVLIWPMLFPTVPPGDVPESVAGRTLAQWSADLEHPNEFVRLRSVRSLRAFGIGAVPALAKALGDQHAGVRYWSASHLGDVATAPKPALAQLKQMKNGKNPAESLAAAYALCRIEGPDRHLGILTERLKSRERGMACCAAEFLGRLGPAAKAAVPALEAAYRLNDRKPGESGAPNADYHVRGASQNALRHILGEWNAR